MSAFCHGRFPISVIAITPPRDLNHDSGPAPTQPQPPWNITRCAHIAL